MQFSQPQQQGAQATALGLTTHEWGVFGAFIVLLIGVSFISPRMASVLGVTVIVVIGAQAIIGGKLLV